VLFAFEEENNSRYQTVNPLNGEVLRTFDEHTDQQMEQMLANADQTFREIWSKKPVRDRATARRDLGP
jgi:succinate-semialdehyde dehydrogenase / glutarate-semialdehyde dehydrogenase